MFYSKFILSSSGALSAVWQAAHWEVNKVKRPMVNETQIHEKVKYIIKPAMPIALRTGGHLLVGVVKIYSKKAQYLFDDATDALAKIKVAFRPGAVDLPAGQLMATTHAITMSEKDLATGDLSMIDFEQFVDFAALEVPRGITAHDDDITLRERDLNITLGGGDDIGLNDMEIELGRDAMMDESFRPEELDHNMSLMSAKGHDTTMGSTLAGDITIEKGRAADESKAEEDDFGMNAGFDDNAGFDLGMEGEQFNVDMDFGGDGGMDLGGMDMDESAVGAGKDIALELHSPPRSHAAEEDSARTAEDEDLVNAPLPHLEATVMTQRKAPQRVRALPLDKKIAMTADEIKVYLADTSDIMRPKTRVSKSRKQLVHQEYVDRLERARFMHEPSMLNLAPELAELITRTITTGRVIGLPYEPEAEEDVEEEMEETVADRTLDHTAAEVDLTTDTLPPMEEVEDEEERQPKRARIEEEEFGMDFGGDNEGFDLGMGGEEVPASPTAGNETEDVFEFSLTQTVGKEPEEDILVPVGDYEMKSKRTQKMLKNLEVSFGKKDDVFFLKSIVKGKDKRTAAAALFEILALKTRDYIDVEQLEPFSDIRISKTDKFVEAQLGGSAEL